MRLENIFQRTSPEDSSPKRKKKVNGWSQDIVHQPMNPAYHPHAPELAQAHTRDWEGHDFVGPDYDRYVKTMWNIKIPHTLDLYTPADALTGDIMGSAVNKIEAATIGTAEELAETAKLALGSSEGRQAAVEVAKDYVKNVRQEFRENFKAEKKEAWANTKMIVGGLFFGFKGAKGEKYPGLLQEYLSALVQGDDDTRINSAITLGGLALTYALTGPGLDALESLNGNNDGSSHSETGIVGPITPGAENAQPCKAEIGDDAYNCGGVDVKVSTPPFGDSDHSGYGYVSVSGETPFSTSPSASGKDQTELEPGELMQVPMIDKKTGQTLVFVFTKRSEANPSGDFDVSYSRAS